MQGYLSLDIMFLETRSFTRAKQDCNALQCPFLISLFAFSKENKLIKLIKQANQVNRGWTLFEDQADLIFSKLSQILRFTKLFKNPKWFGSLTNPWGIRAPTLNPRDKTLKYPPNKCTD